jgi:uncharacterized protein YndB with AHSA1/START domain
MTEATAQVSRTVKAPVDEVWEALTDPDQVGALFMGSKVETDFRVGSPITFKGEFKGKAYQDKGKILGVDERRRLSFSHYSGMSGAPDAPENYHVVTFDLEPDKDATRVTLTQSNLTGGVRAADVEHKADYEKTWSAVLEGLDKAVAH